MLASVRHTSKQHPSRRPLRRRVGPESSSPTLRIPTEIEGKSNPRSPGTRQGCPRAREETAGLQRRHRRVASGSHPTPHPTRERPGGSAGMSIMQSSQLGGYVHALPSPALKDHSLLQNGSDIHHYARAHLPVKYSRRSKKPFLGSTGSVISKTRHANHLAASINRHR